VIEWSVYEFNKCEVSGRSRLTEESLDLTNFLERHADSRLRADLMLVDE